MLFATLYDQSPIGGALPADSDMTEQTAKALQQVAWDTVQNSVLTNGGCNGLSRVFDIMRERLPTHERGYLPVYSALRCEFKADLAALQAVRFVPGLCKNSVFGI